MVFEDFNKCPYFKSYVRLLRRNRILYHGLNFKQNKNVNSASIFAFKISQTDHFNPPQPHNPTK